MGGEHKHRTLKVIVADSSTLCREGLVALAREKLQEVHFHGCSHSQELFECLLKGGWDLAVLDLHLPGRGCLEMVNEIRANWPKLPVLVIGMHPEATYGVRVLRRGASGYVPKCAPVESFIAAVKATIGGGRYVSPQMAQCLAQHMCSAKEDGRAPLEDLSDREVAVLQALTSGKRIKQIANDLELSPKTVSTYRARLLLKLGLEHDADLVKYAIAHGVAAA